MNNVIEDWKMNRNLVKIEELNDDHPEYKSGDEHMGYTIKLTFSNAPPIFISGCHDLGPDFDFTTSMMVKE